MAAPITHIVLANKVFERDFVGRDKLKFMVGTSFPDIRYLVSIDREKTHAAATDLKELKNERDFFAGLKLHSWVDDTRERYMQKAGLYALFPESKYLLHGVKMFEDQVFYEKVENWSEVVSYFREILDEEKELGVTEVDLDRWHKWIMNYFSDFQRLVSGDINLSEAVITGSVEIAQETVRVAREVRDAEKAREIVLRFYDEFLV